MFRLLLQTFLIDGFEWDPRICILTSPQVMLLVLTTPWEELFLKPAREHLIGNISIDCIGYFTAKILIDHFSKPEMIFWEKVQGWNQS